MKLPAFEGRCESLIQKYNFACGRGLHSEDGVLASDSGGDINYRYQLDSTGKIGISITSESGVEGDYDGDGWRFKKVVVLADC